jgi:hypothetical protein
MTTLSHTLITFADNVSILALPPFEDFAGARPVTKVLFAMEMRLGASWFGVIEIAEREVQTLAC